MKPGFVYLMANDRTRRTYLGSTSNLVQRAYQHREALIEGYSKAHQCFRLVWFDQFDDIQDARRREHQMKKWPRGWKVELIEKENPNWDDLYDLILT